MSHMVTRGFTSKNVLSDCRLVVQSSDHLELNAVIIQINTLYLFIKLLSVRLLCERERETLGDGLAD